MIGSLRLTWILAASWYLPMTAAGLLFALSVLVRDPRTEALLFAAAIALAAFGASMGLTLMVRRSLDEARRRAIRSVLEHDAQPCLLSDTEGRVLYRNRAAENLCVEGRIEDAFAALFADPSAVIFRFKKRLDVSGSITEDVRTRLGTTRFSAHYGGRRTVIWRVQKFPSDPTDFMATPTCLADGTGGIRWANDALCALLGRRPLVLAEVFDAAGKGDVGGLVPHETIRADGSREVLLLRPAADRAASADSKDLDRVPVSLMRFSATGELRLANLAAREQLALDVMPTRFTDLFDGLGRSVNAWLADVASGRLPAGAEVLRLKRKAEDVYLQVSLRRVVEGSEISVLAALIDATAIKTLEAQFNQSQKMQAVGQLAGGIAHDFNNLLTAIAGHCDLLLLRHDQGDPEYADLVQINQNANRAASLVGQLLAFSRKQTLKPERLDIEGVLSDVAHLLNRLVGEKVRLAFRYGPSACAVYADRRQLEQVLMNLVVNARDAMQTGGTIVIETERETLRNEMKRNRAVVPPGDYVAIRVRDTGTGIPPDRLDKIFEPFFTTKRLGEGTGLGLSTVYGIIKQSGGFVFVDSAPGLGSTFTVYLPLHTGEVEPKPAVPAASTKLRQGAGVVLLVEDEAPVRAFASRALQMRGYTVMEAQNAEDALAQLEDASTHVDIFVTDVVMPGMDGPTWVQRALQTRPGTKVIFVSGYAEESFPDLQMRTPNSIFLPKPFSLNDLTASVQRQLQ